MLLEGFSRVYTLSSNFPDNPHTYDDNIDSHFREWYYPIMTHFQIYEIWYWRLTICRLRRLTRKSLYQKWNREVWFLSLNNDLPFVDIRCMAFFFLFFSWNRHSESLMVDTGILFSNMKYPFKNVKWHSDQQWLLNRSDFPPVLWT